MYFIIPISSLRTEIPIDTVLLIRNMEISRRIAITVMDIGNQFVEAQVSWMPAQTDLPHGHVPVPGCNLPVLSAFDLIKINLIVR